MAPRYTIDQVAEGLQISRRRTFDAPLRAQALSAPMTARGRPREFGREMVRLSLTQKLNASAEKVWDLIGGYNALPEFHAAIKASALEAGGAIRRLEFAEGGMLRERLLHFDDEKRTHSYTITESSGIDLPFTNYLSTMTVKEDDPGKSCVVEWSGQGDPVEGASEKQVEDVSRAVYVTGFEGLKKIFGG